MESSKLPAKMQNRIRKKLIPWYCQQRYQTSLSQISMNHTLLAASNKRKIKSLLNNNKALAKALERSQYELSDKENIVLNNTKHVDIINLSSVKLKEISDNLKKVISCVDETFTQLQSHVGKNPPKSLYCTSGSRNDFKEKLEAVSNVESLEEVAENLENEQNLKDNKGPVLSIEKAIKIKSKSNAKNTKPDALTNKKDESTIQKSKKRFKAKNAISSQKITVRTSNPYVNETPPSYLLGISSDSESFRNLIEQSKNSSKCNNSKKNAKSRKNQEQKQVFGPQLVSAISIPKVPPKESLKSSKNIQCPKKKSKKVYDDKSHPNNSICAPRKKAKVTLDQLGSETLQNSSEGSLSSIDKNYVESIEKSSSSPLETNFKALTTTLAASFQPKMPDTETTPACFVQMGSQANTMLYSRKVLLESKDCMESDTCIEKQTVSFKKIFDDSKEFHKPALQLKSGLKTTRSCHKKVAFILEDEIETLKETQEPIAKSKIKRTTKRPLKESTPNVEFIPSKKRAHSFSASKALEFKNKNTFVVTAEVHQSADGYSLKKRPSIDNIHLLNLQPTVILTDIFKSNYLKSGILEKIYYSGNQMTAEVPTRIVMKKHNEVLNSESSSSASDFQVKCDKENKIDAQTFLEDRKQSHRRSKVPSYKEMKLNAKMRRC